MFDVSGDQQLNPTKLEVLNISNVNGKGEVVLNDLKLLELIQLYPFLYNPRVRPFQDPDYDEWAWERIASSFNRCYHDPSPPFSVIELQKRWMILVPIIKSLSRAHDIKAIPESLRQIIIKMSVQLEDQTTESTPKPFSAAQSLVLSNIPMVEQLTLADRKRLEAELMEVILASELDARATVKLDPVASKRVEEEYDEFLQTIRVKELFVISSVGADNDEGPTVMSTNSSPIEILGMDEENSLGNFTSYNGNNDYSVSYPPAPPAEELLEPMHTTRWVPLSEAHLHVRPCFVRLKRSNLEEYIPLSKIKRERKY